MYMIFNNFGHCELICEKAPSEVGDGYFVLPGDGIDGFFWSDGQQAYKATTPPPSYLHILQNGKWILPDSVAAQQLKAYKADKLQQLNAAAQAYIDRAAETDKVPDFEVRMWTIQAAEATAWAADKNALTPVLDQIAASRGIDADKLKAAALRKTLAYEKLTAHIAGQRQALQSKIETAKTQAALDKIVITFTALEAV
ncbi:hypothetical protein [Neisseria dentiae]|uniref:hypothetical protein n=1 Tax=Neisseria dentiae TaxID=194197 RepID=UPI00211C3B0D|nr:hypothetical protein [Neisseria dentiae]MCQ9325762.1 hypothetical protein [Neisseria dentiae]